MMRTKDDYRSLNGLQKAALLVMSVGEDTAAKIFQLMHDDEIREISQTMANLGTVERDGDRAAVRRVRRPDLLDRHA